MFDYDAEEDDNFSIGSDDGDDTQWLPHTTLMRTEVHSAEPAARPRSPILRAIMWLCGSPTRGFTDRPPSHGKVALD